MKARKMFSAIAGLVAILCASSALAFNQPPMNLGLTDILDGALPGPGTYFTEYIQAYQSDEFKDKDGNDIPGSPRVGSLLAMNQFVHVYLTWTFGIDAGGGNTTRFDLKADFFDKIMPGLLPLALVLRARRRRA